jgi:hypothetical protein
VTSLHLLANSHLVDTDWTYWFGPADDPVLTLIGVDADGCEWIVDEPEGWQAPVAVTVLDERAYGDGAYAGQTTFTARTLSFGASEPGLCSAPDRATARRAAQRLRNIAGTRTPILYTQTEEPVPQSLWLRASGAPKIRFVDDRAFEFAFVMVADDPMKHDAVQAAGAPLEAGLPTAAGGWRYNLRYPYAYGVGSAVEGTVTPVNAGDETAHTVYTLSGGALDHPTVFNGATGSYFTIDRVLGPLDRVTVDTRAASVLLNGVSIFSDFLGGFPALVPGSNLIQWSHRGLWNSTARLTVVPASAWK